MAYIPTNWQARIAVGDNKFTNSGTLENLVLTPNPDSVQQQGTPFSADLMNKLENGLAAAADVADEANDAVAAATKISVVTSVPSPPAANTMYLVVS